MFEADRHCGTPAVRPLSTRRRIARPVVAVWAGSDMDEVTGLDRFEAVPDTAWHDVRLAGSQQNFRLHAHRPLVAVVEHQFHRSAHDVEKLVTVRMDLSAVRSGASMWGMAPTV
jgi:hypothetical protein